MKRIGSVLILAAGLVALWLTAVASAAPEAPNVNVLTVEAIYQGSDTSVKVGDIFTQRVRIQRTGVVNTIQFKIEMPLPDNAIAAGRPTLVKSGSATINKITAIDDKLTSYTTIAGNGFVEFDLPLRVDPSCTEDPPDGCPVTLKADIINSSDVIELSESAPVVTEKGVFEPNDVNVEAGFLIEVAGRSAESTSPNALSKDGICLNRCETAQILVNNENIVSARIVVRVEAPTGLKWISGNPQFPTTRASEGNPQVRIIDLLVEANTTVTTTLNLELSADTADGTEYELSLQMCTEQAGNLKCPYASGLVDLDPLVYRSYRRDLGDAPDSSNHFATSMDAYTGIVANFPTTADTALAAPHGPVHARPWPLHLGRRVSAEFGADIGPDQDGPNNLEPGFAIPQADLDRGDDGVAIHRIKFEGCKTTTIPVQVAILPSAVAALGNNPAYINVWIDGNRDGDWADTAACDSPAREHIVIDHVVDVATLGAGLHTISMTTGLVPWAAADAAKASWMRVTLSNEKSPKLSGQTYGDGRGTGAAYLMGETEDYLYYGDEPGSEGYQPEIEITVEEVDRGAERRDDLASSGREPNIKLQPNREMIIRIRNTGFKPSKDLQVEVTLADILDQIIYSEWQGCLTCTRSSEVAQSHDSILYSPSQAISPDIRSRIFKIGVLQPQSFTTIVLGWTGCLTCTRSADAISQHTIVARDNGIEWVQKFDRIPDRIASPFIRAAWTGCLTCTRQVEDSNAVTGWDEGVAAVIGTPGTTVNFLKLGDITGESAIIGPDGIVFVTLPVDPNERAVYQAVAVSGAQKSEPSNALDLSCPASGVQILEIRDSNEAIIRYKPAAGNNPEIGFLFSDGFENAVRAPDAGKNRLIYRDCRDQATTISLNYEEIKVTLFDEQQFGDLTVLSWTGCLTCTRSAEITEMTNMVITAVVTPTGQSQAYEYSSAFEFVGTETSGQILDQKTGLPLAGAEVTVLRKVKKGLGRHTWVDVGHCVTTLEDGSWSAHVPAGEYRVIVKKDGYQPYRSRTVSFFDEADALFSKINGRFELGFNIGMPPSVSAELGAGLVGISAGNPGNPFIKVDIGKTLKFINNGGADTSLTALIDGRSPAATHFDSGLLASGELIEIQFDKAGTYTYLVSDDLGQEIVVVVTGSRIYLPMITK